MVGGQKLFDAVQCLNVQGTAQQKRHKQQKEATMHMVQALSFSFRCRSRANYPSQAQSP